MSHIDVELEQVQFNGYSNYAKVSRIKKPLFDARYGLGIVASKASTPVMVLTQFPIGAEGAFSVGKAAGT